MQVDRRRATLAILLALPVLAVVLTQLPLDVAGMRLGALSLLWWYAGVAAPIIATAITLAALTDRAL